MPRDINTYPTIGELGIWVSQIDRSILGLQIQIQIPYVSVKNVSGGVNHLVAIAALSSHSVGSVGCAL